ncbi:GlxA family transcriptional regulator [Leeia sp. TBRC 13508]|uniref:GlxA family transcriptional regulator n=1 Tax=Leeia speluncae TaxID=2884804 RepID=A0ABS8D9L5_9NEIS|nr:GlxA family transcriptional regulator [Leeia speluncae]MCB6184827.1 GlxA family transcriptional regulator [Leeia speluncae]
MIISTEKAQAPWRVGILLLPPCSLLGIGALTDPMSRINRQTGSRAYQYLTLSVDGKPVALYGGGQWPVDMALSDAPTLDVLLVLAEEVTMVRGSDQFLQTLALLSQKQMILGGVGVGAWWLAKAGVLNDYRATIHWSEQARFSDEFEQVILTTNLYEMDRDRVTCAGGTASLDMMLYLIGERQGQEQAAQISEQLCLERIRGDHDKQRVPLVNRIGGSQPKLSEAVMLMEANIEEPLTTDDIAHYVGLSRRQLERLFKQYLNSVPSKYYLELRLNRAKQLLLTTSKSIVQIGLSCGFSSGPHFSSTYRGHFGLTPRDERSQRAMSGVMDE